MTKKGKLEMFLIIKKSIKKTTSVEPQVLIPIICETLESVHGDNLDEYLESIDVFTTKDIQTYIDAYIQHRYPESFDSDYKVPEITRRIIDQAIRKVKNWNRARIYSEIEKHLNLYPPEQVQYKRLEYGFHNRKRTYEILIRYAYELEEESVNRAVAGFLF